MITDNTALYGNARAPESNALTVEQIEAAMRVQLEHAYREGYLAGFAGAREEVARYANTMRIVAEDVKVAVQLHYDPKLIASVPDTQVGRG